MNELPQDPAMLLSYVNTRLRDDFDSLDDMCLALGINRDELTATLAAAGFEYSPENKRFW